MKIQINFRQNGPVLLTLTVLLFALFINPVTGIAQGTYATTSAGRPHDQGGADIAGLVGQLEYNALFGLLGIVVLMGIIYIGHISKACADLNRPQKNVRNLLILVIGLSSFCSSCSVEQQAMAAQYRTAENRSCQINHHYSSQTGPVFNTRYSTNGYSKWYGPSVCKNFRQKLIKSSY
ncbi:MAG: hypothetical protein IPJ82_07075 [Lewinellaceae bacterium]|nr:hypothetical protein [Lewinellaceae bacterium]